MPRGSSYTPEQLDTFTIPKNTTGKCLLCGQFVENERRWCNADCRDNYEKNQ